MQRIDNLDHTFAELAVLQASVDFAAKHDDREAVADMLHRIRAVKKSVAAIEDTAKKVFDDEKRNKNFKIEGLTCILTARPKIDWRLKTAEVKKEMGEPWYNKRCAQVESFALLTKDLVA